MLVLDMSRQTPRFMVETKDQPTCMTLRKDSNFVPRPIYGANTGYVYKMDQTTYNVANTAYMGEFQTPHMDFGFADQSLGGKSKLFDFLRLTFTSSGNWPFYVDVIIDGIYSETITYAQNNSGALMDSFILDVSRLGDLHPVSLRKPLHGAGRTISFRIYNNGLNEYFKIESMAVSFRISGEQAHSSVS
jgi:hypothetical protein